MGELANQAVNGEACELCLCPFVSMVDEEKHTFVGYAHGYPVVCSDCWMDLTPEEKKFHQRAVKPTL